MKHFSTTFPGSGRQLITWLRPYLAALLLLLLAAPLARAQAPAPAWQSLFTVGASGINGAYISATAADASGNIFIAGGFSGTVPFGSTTLTSAGRDDVFVAKWSPATNGFVWAQRAGGTSIDYVNALAVSGSSVYLVGVFGSTQLVCGSTTLTNAGPTTASTVIYDAFVAKLTDAGSSGSFVWAQSVGGTGVEYGNGVAVSGSSVYFVGQFGSPTAAFGPLTLTNNVTTGSGNNISDVYVAKLTDAGSTSSFSWAERIGGTGGDYCSGIAISGSNIYLGGSFGAPTARLGSLVLTNADPAGTATDVFVTKLLDQGTAPAFVWAQRAGGTGPEEVQHLAASPNGVYIVGRWYGAPARFGNAVLVNAGQLDAYVAKLTDAGASGGFEWAQQLGGPTMDYAYGLDVRGGSVYVAGNFQNTATFGPHTLTSLGADDVFVVRLADAGPTAQVVWAQQAGGPGSDAPSAVLVMGSRVYIAGGVGVPAAFGTLPVASPVGGSATFLASMTDLVGLATTGPRALPDVAVYPNPAHATATVQLPPVPGASAATIAITDALGRVVRTATVPLPAAGLRHELDLAGLPAGLYAVRVAAAGRSATHRLVVE
ncbi:hypothetical protein GCM10028824_29840 [Hymenobacter segetis]|uniref:T9SS type A sorting domain-containing protein n=1 Tax=Hymenobacter segetis TaxID=2025509 RepID=A0ABU9LUW5_9BACT